MKKSSERFLKESEVNIWLKEITLIVQPELQIVVLRVFLRAEHFLWNLRQTLFWKRSNIVAIMKIHRLWNIMKSSFHSNAVGCQMPKIRIVYFLFCQRGWHWKFEKWWLTVIVKYENWRKTGRNHKYPEPPSKCNDWSRGTWGMFVEWTEGGKYCWKGWTSI